MGPSATVSLRTGLVTAGANKGSTMAWIEHEYPDPQALVAGVSAVFEATRRSAIAAHGSALLCFAGGRTPLPIYAHLAHARLRGTLTAIPGDERCVPHTHAASAICAICARRSPPMRHPSAATHHHRWRCGCLLGLARTWLAAHPQDFDAVLLGMGGDGHFASLFPGAANVTDGLALDSGMDAIATTPNPLPPEAPFARISLTLPRLLRAAAIHLVVTGADKRRVLREAQQQSHSPYPIAALLQGNAATPIHIHWSP
ncbi:MAG: 6-phosphogluconolactonase [Lysobacterales bacterium]